MVSQILINWVCTYFLYFTGTFEVLWFIGCKCFWSYDSLIIVSAAHHYDVVCFVLKSHILELTAYSWLYSLNLPWMELKESFGHPGNWNKVLKGKVLTNYTISLVPGVHYELITLYIASGWFLKSDFRPQWSRLT